jgi:hypothetical protein
MVCASRFAALSVFSSGTAVAAGASLPAERSRRLLQPLLPWGTKSLRRSLRARRPRFDCSHLKDLLLDTEGSPERAALRAPVATQLAATGAGLQALAGASHTLEASSGGHDHDVAPLHKAAGLLLAQSGAVAHGVPLSSGAGTTGVSPVAIGCALQRPGLGDSLAAGEHLHVLGQLKPDVLAGLASLEQGNVLLMQTPNGAQALQRLHQRQAHPAATPALQDAAVSPSDAGMGPAADIRGGLQRLSSSSAQGIDPAFLGAPPSHAAPRPASAGPSLSGSAERPWLFPSRASAGPHVSAEAASRVGAQTQVHDVCGGARAAHSRQPEGAPVNPWYSAPRAQPPSVSADQLRQAVHLLALYHQQQQHAQAQAQHQAQFALQQQLAQHAQHVQAARLAHSQPAPDARSVAQPQQSTAPHVSSSLGLPSFDHAARSDSMGGGGGAGAPVSAQRTSRGDDWDSLTAAALQRLTRQSPGDMHGSASLQHAPEAHRPLDHRSMGAGAMHRLLSQLPSQGWSGERQFVQHGSHQGGDVAPAAFGPWGPAATAEAGWQHERAASQSAGSNDRCDRAAAQASCAVSNAAEPAGVTVESFQQQQHMHQRMGAQPARMGSVHAAAAVQQQSSGPDKLDSTSQMHQLQPAAAAILKAIKSPVRSQLLEDAPLCDISGSQLQDAIRRASANGQLQDALLRVGSGSNQAHAHSEHMYGAWHAAGGGAAPSVVKVEQTEHAQLAALLAQVVRASSGGQSTAQASVLPHSLDTAGQGRPRHERGGSGGSQHNAAPAAPSERGAASALAG